MKGLIGKKVGMTQVYAEDGSIVPVTAIQAGPCVVVDVKTQEKNGYSALQLGFASRKVKNVSKPMLGHFKRSGVDATPPAFVREIRLASDPQVELGTQICADTFEVNEYLDVTGQTKGRGFQGVVKRHNFGGGRASHGGAWTRRPGSIGMCEFPAHVMKGKKLPGHMGNARKTIQNLRIVSILPEDNIILVKGAVPGPNGGVLTIKSARKKSGGR